jgi:hypothetical protein
MVLRILGAKRTDQIRMIGLLVVLGMVTTGCQVRGGGHLPAYPPETPGTYSGEATFGFTVECQTVAGKPKVRGELSYLDQGPSMMSTGLQFDQVKLHGEAVLVTPLAQNVTCETLGYNYELFWTFFPRGAAFEGWYRAQGSDSELPGTFKVTLFDQGEPGRSPYEVDGDYFSIELVGGHYPGYSRGGYVDGGNIQVEQ